MFERERTINQEYLGLLIQVSPQTLLVEEALDLAYTAHHDVLRKSGEPYINHPIAVYQILSKEWGLSEKSHWQIHCATLLHDTVEDTHVTLPQIEDMWGQEVSHLVDSVTKFRNNLDSFKKIATDVDVRSAIIKLADRLHNMRTLEFLRPEKRIKIAQETMDVYCPLADSLGMWEVKEELQDLAFKYLNPEAFAQVVNLMNLDPRLSDNFIDSNVQLLQTTLTERNTSAEIRVRKKGIYSTYLKHQRLILTGQSLPDNLSGMDDLVSYAIICDSTNDCYTNLGVIHQKFSGLDVEGNICDQLSRPATNGYQALKTALSLDSQHLTEIAFMTEEMYGFNRQGMAYNLEKNPEIRQSPLIPIFTESGIVFFLPTGSTGVDVLAHLNPKLATHDPRIFIDGVEVDITSIINVGATVEIIPAQDESTSIKPGLLESSSQRSREILRNIQISAEKLTYRNFGRQQVNTELTKRGIIELTDLGDKYIIPILKTMGNEKNPLRSTTDLYDLIGGGFLTIEQFKQVLESLEISREKMGLTSIVVTGNKDEPGIIEKLSKIIAQQGGNIMFMRTDVDSENHFEVRVLIKEMNIAKRHAVNYWLSQEKKFSKIKLV